MDNGIQNRFLRFASRLRYPKLLALIFGIFILDVAVPDFLPFADEILLGLFSLLVAGLKKAKRDQQEPGVQ